MNNNIKKCIIRKLNENDYENYIKIINEFRETFFTKKQFEETIEYMVPYSQIWVVEYDDDIIATGTIIYEKKFIHNNSSLGHIEDICVKKEYRKFGIGKLIVLHLMNESKINGCYKVTLDCSEENSYFYEKCGLEKRGFQMCQLTCNF